MLPLKRGQRRLLADKLADAANLVLGALVLGTVLATGRTPVILLLAGSIGWARLMLIAVVVIPEAEG